MSSQTDGRSGENDGNNAGIHQVRAADRRKNSTDGADGGKTGSRVNVKFSGEHIHFTRSQNNCFFYVSKFTVSQVTLTLLLSFNGDIF